MAPDVGGGFGLKNFIYPEWVLLLWAARKLDCRSNGRAIAAKSLQATQGRGIAHSAARADADGKFFALMRQ